MSYNVYGEYEHNNLVKENFTDTTTLLLRSTLIRNKNYMKSITCSDNGKYVAVSSRFGGVYTSDDYGISWKNYKIDINITTLDAIASSSDSTGQYLVTCATNNYGIYFSNNYGISWTKTNALTLNWVYILISKNSVNNLFKIIAAVDYNMIYISYDSGDTWTTNSPMLRWLCIASDISFTNFIACDR